MLDETCYDRHDFGLVDDENDATVLTGYFGPKKNPRTEKIFWTNKAPNNTGRRLRSCDILPRAPAPATLLAPASDIDSIANAFHCLFTPDMVELVVKHTNTKIQHVQGNLPEYYSRVQTDPGKPGKTGKMVNFERNQGNSGKPREFFLFSFDTQGNSGNSFLRKIVILNILV